MCAGHVSSERAGIADDLFTGLFIYVAARKKEQHWQAILKHWQAIVKNKTHKLNFNLWVFYILLGIS